MDYLEPSMDENGQMKTMLKRNHPYFTQVQIQMWVTQAKFCHFFVYSSVDYKHVIVPYDEKFC